jgi:hypothetical protein
MKLSGTIFQGKSTFFTPEKTAKTMSIPYLKNNLF